MCEVRLVLSQIFLPTPRDLSPCIRAGKAFTHETFTGASATVGTAWCPASLALVSLSWTGAPTTTDGRLSMYPCPQAPQLTHEATQLPQAHPRPVLCITLNISMINSRNCNRILSKSIPQSAEQKE